MSKTIVEGRFANAEFEFYGQVEISQETGRITKIADKIGKPDVKLGEKEIAFPGMVDVHIHAREDETEKQNYKETYQTANDAAINGGVVCCCAMPNTPNPLLTSEQLEWHKNRHKNLPVTFLNYAGIGPDTKPIKSKKEVPYKVFTGPSVGQLFFKSKKELRNSLKNYYGKHISFHVEDYDILQANKGKPTHDQRRPVKCVEVALEYVLEMIKEFDLKAKLCHWPIGGNGLEMIKKHRKKGFKTLVEVSPLYLYFDTEMTNSKPELWPYLQANPSIRSKKDRLELIEALRDGTIDIIATDHAPHTLDEKFENFGGEMNYLKMKKENGAECKKISCIDGTSGTPQLDTYGTIAAWLMSEHKFTPKDIARVTSFNPGKFVNKFLDRSYGKGFGKIAVGYQGSLTIVDLGKKTTVKREDLKTKCGWSPFEEIEFKGKVTMTIIKGNPYYV
ncbi:MAG: amidohydrolase family protein [Candidatus Micrarchaeota archaeon]